MNKIFKYLLKHKIPFIRDWTRGFDNSNLRAVWVEEKLRNLSDGSVILDAGCGSQQYRKFCDHLNYRGQDFGKYVSDDKKMLGSQEGGLGGVGGYQYGELDYCCDIWDICEDDATFDAVLCTEVFEHIVYPLETVREFSRLLKCEGTLILTVPSNCLRHMDPYFYYSGFSDRWLEEVLGDNQFEIVELEPIGDYYSWMAVEVARTAIAHGFVAKVLLTLAFFFFSTRKKTGLSVNTLCMGYHVVAKRKRRSSGIGA